MLPGGVSATVTGLEAEWHGLTRRLVVRQYGPRDLRARPEVARQEFALLAFLHGAGLCVPQPLYHESGVLISQFIAGENGEGFVDPPQMAAFLADLHRLDVTGLPLHPLPDVIPASRRPDDTLSEGRIREALRDLPPAQVKREALLHGDFWPGNTVWHDGKLAGVLDWEDAALGHPLSDVGNARLELLFFHGPQAMQAFTNEYARLTGRDFTALPYWDLRAALRPCGRMQEWGLAPAAETRLRERHADFVQSALESLGGA